MRETVGKVLTLRLPGWILFVLWVYFGVKAFFFSGWIQESFTAALGYVREVSFAAPGDAE